MANYSYSEFKQDLPSLWEVDLEIDRQKFHYERDYIRQDDAWRFWLSGSNGMLIFNETANSQDGMTDKVLSLKIYEGKTIAELWDRLEITNLI